MNFKKSGLIAISLTLIVLIFIFYYGPRSHKPMIKVSNGYKVHTLLTIGETISNTNGGLNPSTEGDYTPVGIMDGIGAYELDKETVRVFVNHELKDEQGYEYKINDGKLSLKGARISYFDIDKSKLKINDAGIAYNKIFDANGKPVSDLSFQPEPFATIKGEKPGDGKPMLGLNRFCSASFFEANQFETGGLEKSAFFAGEEDGGISNTVGGAEWVVDPETGNIWQIPAMGRGSWENITEICTENNDTVAFILSDDTAPFDADNYDADQINGDSEVEAAPLYLYIGAKKPRAKINGIEDFLAINGLRKGKLYVWAANDLNIKKPSNFNSKGIQTGRWVEIDNSRNISKTSEDGSTGFDNYGYPTQRTLWTRAEDLGAFGFSRPEDVSTNPNKCNEAVLASTGVYSFDGGADTAGTLYTINTNFSDLSAELKILYDGDADPAQQIRSPDNLDWADDGLIYVQEDKAVKLGEPVLFGEGAINENEASILSINPINVDIKRIAEIDRNNVFDPTIPFSEMAIDRLSGISGGWETSGILDVSKEFGRETGTLFILSVQAHGIKEQSKAADENDLRQPSNSGSRINNDDLVEGGQLLLLELRDD